MKKASITVGLALCCLALVCCNKQPQEEEVQTTPSETSATGLKIAYVEIDSLMANYQLCKDYTEIGNMEADNIKRTLESKQRTLEQHYSAMQQKYESNGFTSQEELQRAQTSLQKEQESLEELSNRLSNSFQEQQLKYNAEMRDSIQNFLKGYNKNKKFDLIISKAGDNILYANPQYDITNEVLKGLNKRYKASAEVTEKLKNKPAATEK
ncbi:MAG: OmpH family outer membrane protein [Prevotellaceae bacterium]|nr:OmpH family outer membrane protein [Prevotellaceae bacterium]